jgi:hypothetical protein
MKLTDQFIDLKNGGIWITETQDIMFTGWLLGVYLANIVLVFAGALLCIALFIVGVITMFLAPLNLVLHLVLGIIQTMTLIKKA